MAGLFALPFMGPLLGAAAGGILGLGSTMYKSAADRSAANTAWDRSQLATAQEYERYKKRYQDTTADMKAAGLNPILAASGGFQVGSSAVQAARVPHQHPAGLIDFGSSAKTVSDIQKTRSETEVNIKKLNVLSKQASLIQQKIVESGSLIAKMGAEQAAAWQQARKYMNEAVLMFQRYKTEVQNSTLTETKVKQLQKMFREYDARIEQLNRTAEFYKGPAGGIATAFREWFSAFGSILGGLRQ